MKKLLLSVLGVMLFVGVSTAQEYKPFKLGLGLGYAIPGGEGAGGGILIYGEPSYRVNDAIAVGLRLEAALIIRGLSESFDGYSADIAGITSYTVNGQYYLKQDGFRPLVGLGLGMYSLSAVEFDETVSAAKESKFGFYPRVGFDAGHFNFLIEYNLIPATKTDIFGEDIKIKNSYVSIKAGVSIFGGKR